MEEGCELWGGNERKKNEMGEEGCMCMVGEKKKERQGVHGWWEKKKEIKKKKEMGSGVYVYSEKKRGSGKEIRKKIWKGKN